MTPDITPISYEKELDRTLRFLYRTLSRSNGLLLAIRFTYRGRQYEADRAEEAKSLIDLLESIDRERAQNDPEFARKLLLEKTGWTQDKFWHLVNGIGEMQAKLLEAIYGNEYPIFADDLAKKLELKSQVSLAGVLSGFSKQAKQLGVRVNDVYQVNTYWHGKTKRRMFTITEAFREIAKEEAWPFISLLKKGEKKNAASTK
jgi:hypothetical protein